MNTAEDQKYPYYAKNGSGAIYLIAGPGITQGVHSIVLRKGKWTCDVGSRADIFTCNLIPIDDPFANI